MDFEIEKDTKTDTEAYLHQKELTKKNEKAAAYFKALECIKGKQIAVPRLAEVEAQRRKLPIYAEEQPIVEAINENTVGISNRILTKKID